MYYVYKVELMNHVYVGCTNNISHRATQHRSNAKIQKGNFGKFLYENSIILKTSDMVSVSSFENRKEALCYERSLTMDLEKSGCNILNDNYSKNCSRKGKNIGNTAQDYVVVDMVNHCYNIVKDLRQYSISQGIDYKLLHRTYKGNHFYNNRYKAFKLADWESLTNKDIYLSGKIIDIEKERRKRENQNRCSKTYLVEFPDKSIHEVTNLDEFARNHNLTSGTLHATILKGRPTKGYKVIKRI